MQEDHHVERGQQPSINALTVVEGDGGSPDAHHRALEIGEASSSDDFPGSSSPAAEAMSRQQDAGFPGLEHRDANANPVEEQAGQGVGVADHLGCPIAPSDVAGVSDGDELLPDAPPPTSAESGPHSTVPDLEHAGDDSPHCTGSEEVLELKQ